MTTIAYKDGVMAADSRAYAGGATPIGTKVKIRQMEDGTLIGISCNSPGLSEQLFAWFEADMDTELSEVPEVKDISLSILVVSPDGEVRMALDSIHPVGPIEADFFAIGTGDHFALGAMAAGATAKEAVTIGIELDIWSGAPVRTISLDKKPSALKVVAA